MPVPKHTSDIFEILSKGQFICSNSSKDNIRKLYNVIDENFDDLFEYFMAINLKLEKGDEYYMFTREENKTDLERKIEAAYKWIDMLDFFKTVDHAFGPGYRFTPSEILIKLTVDVDLKNKLEGLKKYAGGKEKHADILDKVLDQLRRDNFIELENEITNGYKTLSSFHYLERLILSINIPEAAQK
jgi:predicted AlkP superfamily pyrophosphatase or phosphodiesterase